eukprot:4968797-Amphidinium_carterae.1
MEFLEWRRLPVQCMQVTTPEPTFYAGASGARMEDCRCTRYSRRGNSNDEYGSNPSFSTGLLYATVQRVRDLTPCDALLQAGVLARAPRPRHSSVASAPSSTQVDDLTQRA